MIERDDSLTNLANEIVRALISSRTLKSELLSSLECVFEAGKDVLQSDSAALATSWTNLYILYLDNCTVNDREITEWVKQSRDMVSVRHLDHTRHCGAMLMSKLIVMKKLTPIDKDWGNTIGLLTSGTDLLVEVALSQLVASLISAYPREHEYSENSKQKESTLERHFGSLVSAALEVFSCERSHIKRLACLKFFSDPSVYSLLTQEAKHEFIILLKADLVTDQSSYDLQLETDKPNFSSKTSDQLQQLVLLLIRLIEDQDTAVREAFDQIWDVIKSKHPHVFIKLFCTLEVDSRALLAPESEFRSYFEQSSKAHVLWYHGGCLPTEFISLLIKKVPSGNISSLDYIGSAWPEGTTRRLLGSIIDHELLYQFIQECIVPDLILKLSSATLSWRPLLNILQIVRREVMELQVPRVLSSQNQRLLQQMAEDFTRVTVQIFAKPLVTHMVPIQEELIEWIALLHNLSPQIKLVRRIDSFMVSLHDSGKKRESVLLDKLRARLTELRPRFGNIGDLARAVEKLTQPSQEQLVQESENSRKVEIKVRSNSIGRGSSTGRSDSSLGPARSHRRGGPNAFQMNSSSGLRVPGLPSKTIKETSVACTKCGTKGCKCAQGYSIPTPFQALNPQKSPPTPSHATSSIRGLASGSLVSVKLVQKPLTLTEIDPSSQSNSPVLGTPGPAPSVTHQSKFSIHLLSQPDTPTSNASTAGHSGRVKGLLPAKLNRLKRSTTFSETPGIHQSLLVPSSQKGLLEVEQSYQDSGSYNHPNSDSLSGRRRNSSLSNARTQTENVLKELSNTGSVTAVTKPTSFQITQPKKFRFLVSKHPLPATTREADGLPRTQTAAGSTALPPAQEPKKPPPNPRPRGFQVVQSPNENISTVNTSAGPPKISVAIKRLPKLGSQQSRKDSIN